jgi:hypothetical protein
MYYVLLTIGDVKGTEPRAQNLRKSAKSAGNLTLSPFENNDQMVLYLHFI